jgi:nitric oxide reductase subunit B
MKPGIRPWLLLGGVVALTFLILGLSGGEIHRQAPPLPGRVVTERGRLVATKERILDGQEVWQGMGGQQIGSTWGHGACQAPDWSSSAGCAPGESGTRDP